MEWLSESQLGNSFEANGETTADHPDSDPTTLGQPLSATNSQSSPLAESEMQDSEQAGVLVREVPESMTTIPLPQRRGMERYNLRPRPQGSMRLQGFVVD
ncbi:hypothetical protein NDU88_000840 [Pleurodeles waltl]|uniref:Uncharacterized protein n=1 Tax=Pleurodeles waltl TaxID=8319 RepID=A0AAV7V813_PLEWA|nr:hypothetical protein NDU88_000840 [Pleurodeles waltl]